MLTKRTRLLFTLPTLSNISYFAGIRGININYPSECAVKGCIVIFATKKSRIRHILLSENQ